MRKIDDQLLMQMIESGKPQKECAGHFGVTPSAINQRIKRLKAYDPPESFNRLTDKQRAFVLAKVEGKTNLAAIQSAYDVTTKESGKALATQLMQDPDVKIAIADLMHTEGIGRRRRIQRLRDLIESPDLTVAGKGLDMSFKVCGEYAQERHEVIIDHQAMIADLRAAQKRMIEAGLLTDVGEAIDVTPARD